MAYGAILGQSFETSPVLDNYFTKDETLTSSTAALFGLGADSVPDDVLAYVGKYNQHWWKRRKLNGNQYEYLQSSSRSAYPDSGEQGGYEYQYLGIPFDNAATVPKIATGSYVGTGKYGSSNPNSLTFEFEPKIVFVFDRATPAVFFIPALSGSFTGKGYGYTILYNSSSSFYDSRSNAKFSEKTLSWYYGGTDSSLDLYQLNYSGRAYYYIAIG